MSLQYPIKVVSHRTGLSQHVIRVWEKRYGAVSPNRTGTNRRLYSDEEVDRLIMLRQATEAGHNIGSVAGLQSSELQEILKQSPAVSPASAKTPARTCVDASEFVDACIEETLELDDVGLEEVLSRASVELGHQGLLQNVIVPLTRRIGDQWQEGTLRVAHEHFASSIIRSFLEQATRPFAVSDNAPTVIVTTPAGQLHELGAVIVAATAASRGWKVTYLGSSLPASEIAGAAIQNRARAVALSVIYPDDDPNMATELAQLRRVLPASIPILIGGRAAPTYKDAIAKIGATLITDLPGLSQQLDDLRARK
ncbi:MAG TPA: MerR family transcriptional regulator [Roseimicrobium sp.]|nr:MerR family transcriptional regulator [Roseimicrobium sp.]